MLHGIIFKQQLAKLPAHAAKGAGIERNIPAGAVEIEIRAPGGPAHGLQFALNRFVIGMGGLRANLNRAQIFLPDFLNASQNIIRLHLGGIKQ